MDTTSWPIPDGLSPKGRSAAETILAYLTETGRTYHGGGGRFYTPQEWVDRGEEYGTDSLLVITHDGGDHAPVFNYAYDEPELGEELRRKLQPLGLFVEQCTSWSSAVYAI
ncbi:hypothetical protein [Tsukamurella tyrosinosolvens]|uniref:Uncharacterized protein n=1 Tax=Tsukamurella tyrosinosolvens TaxID=57704 RepID=A0A1H4UP80_TSUTY|nr:hypothetical protein [Tsukamurella tyrosinosolvens]SEC70536.1 hypothetical protein SAMN04489793_2968 [Tsukamurella tyrosinosolvens]